MTKDRSGSIKKSINYLLIIFGINGVICVSTSVMGLATDKRLLGSYEVDFITSFNNFIWNVQFFSFWILVLGVVIGSFLIMIYTIIFDKNSSK